MSLHKNEEKKGKNILCESQSVVVFTHAPNS